jgi:aspartate-semialdehyde dehydrogenase
VALMQRRGRSPAKVVAKQIAFNCVPQIDEFLDNGYTKEEMKMFWETQKIIGDKSIQRERHGGARAGVLRPFRGINIETRRKLSAAEARRLLQAPRRRGHGRARSRAAIRRRYTEARTTTRFTWGASAKICRTTAGCCCGSCRITSARALPNSVQIAEILVRDHL